MGKYSNYNPLKVRLHVVALKALQLGVVGTVSATTLLTSLDINSVTFRIATHTLFNCIFHLLEFLVTALCNCEEVDDDSFILTDPELFYVYIAAVLEAATKSLSFPYLPKLTFTWFALGLVTVVLGQFCRSLAMYTAGASFHHHIQREASEKRPLVTRGIYSVMRHPSYFGYFWWFVGSQVLLQNPVVGFLGAYKLIKFFKDRISYEEEFLVAFFGPEYVEYRRNTSTKIPFIP